MVILGRDGRPRWSPLWDGNPYIIKRPAGRPHNRLVNGPDVRPYVAAKTHDKWTWKPFEPTPAELFFTPEELAFAEPYRGMVMIEPNVKAQRHDNKAWDLERWADVRDALHVQGHHMVQCAADLQRYVIKPHVFTPTFRHACAVLSVCKAFVGTEGGLHHAAAAVGTPAVVLWSEFISPAMTGYLGQRNIRHAGASCGSRNPCNGCRKSMEAITVDEVVTNLLEILK